MTAPRSTRFGPRSGGIDGNERLTAATAVVLLVLLAVEGVTILFLGRLLSVLRASAVAAALAAGVVLAVALVPLFGGWLHGG